jgi:hypothetical protein
MFRPAAAIVLVCLALAAAGPVLAARQMEDMSFVVLRTTDKLSARTHTFEIPVEKTVKFGKSLYIKARACRKASPLDKPENAAFLQIWERKPGEDDSQWVFSGWMFSSSPSLSAMDHPVYDVWVIDCKNAATSAKSEVFSSEASPAGAPATESDNGAPATESDNETPAAAAEAPAAAKDESRDAAEIEAEPLPAPQSTTPASATPRLEDMPSSFEETGD